MGVARRGTLVRGLPIAGRVGAMAIATAAALDLAGSVAAAATAAGAAAAVFARVGATRE